MPEQGNTNIRIGTTHGGRSDGDTIYVYGGRVVESRAETRFRYDEEVAESLPSHVDRWHIESLDSLKLANRGHDQPLRYLLLAVLVDTRDELIIEAIEMEKDPEDSATISIDRGRMRIVFERKGSTWSVRDLISFYG